MRMLRANVIRSAGFPRALIFRCLMGFIFLHLTVIFLPAQTEKITTAVTPIIAGTTDADTAKNGNLAVGAPTTPKYKNASSTLVFDTYNLPKDNSISSAYLQLVPNSGSDRGMRISVKPGWTKTFVGREHISSGTPDGNPGTSDIYSFSNVSWNLVSPPLPEDKDSLRSDGVMLAPSNSNTPFFNLPFATALVLTSQGSGSWRVYYGLNTKESPNDSDHPDRLPRLIVTYNRTLHPDRAALSEPSPLALVQSDGRQADTTTMPANLPLGQLNGSGTESAFKLDTIATDSQTIAPVVYGNLLYVVRKDGETSYLQVYSAKDGHALNMRMPLPGKVLDGSLMVIDRYGRLRIITNDAILETTVDPMAVTTFTRRDFSFGQVPKMVVPGPDGTLYIVQNSIYALNPDAGERSGNEIKPTKLWDVAIADPDAARITLNPAGTFLYVLGHFAGGKSGFEAINAQTGRSARLTGGTVNTSAKTITWVKGMKFERISVGQSIPLGSKSCHVMTVNPASTRLTCAEGFDAETGVSWGAFPDNLINFRNPVVMKTPKGDFIYITGSTGTRAYLWGVRNEPETRDGSSVARFTGVWNYTSDGHASEGQQFPYYVDGIGQPILDVSIPGQGNAPSEKKLYFLERGAFNSPGTKLTVVNALNGTMLSATNHLFIYGVNDIGVEGNLIADKDGVLFCSSDVLVTIMLSPHDRRGWNSRPLHSTTPPNLFFGSGGSLFTANSSNVSFLSPAPAQ